jgi:hypothetical protein
MAFNVPIGSQTYAFDGPFTSADQLDSRSGVYLVSTVTEGSTRKILDVGESGDVQDRVTNHDRKPCWTSNQQSGLSVMRTTATNGRG